MRPTILEVDLKKIEANINNIKKYVGNKKIMPIIKANGYGTYINKNIDFLNKFDIVAVAIVDEAIELRNIGYKKEIFVLNPPYIEEIEEIIKYDITVCLCEKTFLKNLSNINDKIKVYIPKGDTINVTEHYNDTDGWGCSRKVSKTISDFEYLTNFGEENNFEIIPYTTNDKVAFVI